MNKLFDVLALLLASDAKAETKARSRLLIQELASNFDAVFPRTMKSMMMHQLLFHVPAAIRMWGPARGFWCFPFERYITAS